MPGYPMFKNLLIALPITGRPIPPDVMFGFHAMAYPMNFNHMVSRLQGLPIADARNQFAEIAIANQCKYIWFWDEDVLCPPHSIPELIYKMEHIPDAAVIGGIYCLKRDPPEPLVFRGNGNGCYWDWKAGEFFEVSGIGMGNTIVRTEVFADLKKPWFKTEFNYKGMMDGNQQLETWTEDLWFCDRVTKTNKWKVYADGSLICSHYDMTTCKPYDLPKDSKPVKHMMVNQGKTKILDLGSGANKYKTAEGVIVTADEEKYSPDYRCDLRKLPFAPESFDIVFSQALESFAPEEIDEVLTEWIRVVKKSGEMRFVVSDVNWIAQQIVDKHLGPETIYNKKRLSGFTYESIKKYLANLGWNNVEKVKSDPAHIAVRAKRK